MKTNERILFLLTNEKELEEANKFAGVMRKKFANVEIVGLYVKDIMKYELFLTNVNGFIQNSTSMVINEYKNLEEKIYKKVKDKALQNFDKVYSVEGDTHDTVLEEMKAFDVLVVIRQGDLSLAMKNLLKDNYKPLIILGQKKEYKLDKILMLNDGGFKINKSIFAYFHLFGEQQIDVLRVNVEDNNRIVERFGDVCNVIDETGPDVYEIIKNYIPKYDMVIMGELRYTVLFEKLTRQVGVKIIENSNTPIFIG